MRPVLAGASPLCVLLVVGCAALSQSAAPQPTRVRFYLARSAEHEGYRAAKDESGQPLYVAPEPFLTEQDISQASVFASRERTLIELEFRGLAAARLEQVTRANIGSRLAVFINDQLILSPWVQAPTASRKLLLDGGFSRARAEEIVRGLGGVPSTAPAVTGRAP